MISQFCKYFFQYIIRAKTRQRLLFLAIVGIFISAFALIVLQSTMGGLQKKQISRSKSVLGSAVVFFKRVDDEFVEKIYKDLKSKGITLYPEYEIELLLQHRKYLSGVIVHALDMKDGVAEFLGGKFKNVVVPNELSRRLNIDRGDRIHLISPAHASSFMGDIPRLATTYVDRIIVTNVTEVEIYHIWTRASLIQNLIRNKHINRLRIYSDYDFEALREKLKEKYKDDLWISTWEEQHQTLVWALKLETTVMVFLFIAMTMLVSLCITSGLMIFLDKIRNDLASFWILGASKEQLNYASIIFINVVSLASVTFGLLAGILFLYLLDHYGATAMPEVFVDRKIPVHISTSGIVISFFVPYVICLLFSLFSLAQFKREMSYLDQVRTVG